ncbi:MAG: hypothetical protein HS111_23435 [Kofleriaceae bacterium]|nr:hypothetical protein [Kofleriaceae bacterium]
MKFRSSTNAEDLARPAAPAGLAIATRAPARSAIRRARSTSRSRRCGPRCGTPAPSRSATTPASITCRWRWRCWAAPSFPDEEANGVAALTANIYDPAPGGGTASSSWPSSARPAWRQPPPGVRVDSLLYYYFHVGQPATCRTAAPAWSPPARPCCITRSELFELGRALAAIRDGFAGDFDPPAGWRRRAHGRRVEARGPSAASARSWVKQARPYPGRGAEAARRSP